MITSHRIDLLLKIHMDPAPPPPNQGVFDNVCVSRNTVLVNYAI